MLKQLKQSFILCVAFSLTMFLISFLFRPLFHFNSSGYVSSLNIVRYEEEVPNILKKIAYCESGNRQYEEGSELPLRVLRGRQNPLDVGRFQINEYYHLKTSQALGMDIYTWEGNTQYALYLYKKNGTRDWSWSKFCWSKL